ncbi:hypothetical protein E8E11_006075 [Didymella keratinophila]|nr:hypothetical protein E8E11_006075 [Didymella keratinophila]
MGEASRRLLARRSAKYKCPPSSLSKEVPAEVTTPEQSSPADEAMHEDTPTSTHPSSVNSNVKIHVPSPHSDSADPFSQYVSKLSEERRKSISQLISATQRPLSEAVDALIQCEWDLLKAIAISGGNARDENEDDEGGDDDDGGDDSDGAQEELQEHRNASLGTRSRLDLDVRHWFTLEEERRLYKQYSTATERLSHLRRRWYNRNHNQDWPQNPRNAVFEPITLQFSPSSPNTHTIPEFMSPYGDRKLWYTGFMGP